MKIWSWKVSIKSHFANEFPPFLITQFSFYALFWRLRAANAALLFRDQWYVVSR